MSAVPQEPSPESFSPALPLAQIAIGTWLVLASRWLTGTGVSASGALDDAALVLLLAAVQCAWIARARTRIAAVASAVPTLLVALFLLGNQLHFTFFKTNLGLVSFQLGDLAVDAHTSVTDLLGPLNVSALLLIPVAAQAFVIRRLGGRPGPRVAGLFAFAGLLVAGIAGVLRHDVFIFPDHNPAMNVFREIGTSVQELVLGSPRLELERTATTLFNRDGYLGYEFAGTPERPLYQRAAIPSHEPASPVNIVLILMESVRGFEMVGPMREVGVTPVLNGLESDSLVFGNFYYNGMRTVDGEFSILCSALPLVNAAPVYKSHPEIDIRCLPEILRDVGYDTHWISAYRSSYAGKGRFLRGHGVRGVHDDASMDTTRVSGPDIGWGMADLDMYEQAIEKINRFREPFFTEIMTLSNHHPFDHDYRIEFPESLATVPGTQHYRDYLRGIYYTDHAIGEFLEAAREQPWFDRTLFVIVGDHGVRAYPERPDGSAYGPVLETEIYFRGRLILYGPGVIEPGESDTLGSQIDVAPTLLDLLQIRADNSFLGVSLLAPVPNERRFALTNIGHVWNMRVGDKYCYSVGYSCFIGVFPRCEKGVQPTFAGHTCLETPIDLMAANDTSSGRPLDDVEREELLSRARKIMEVNRTLVREDRFR